MGATPLSLLAERARLDSLFKRLERAGLLGEFFSWYFAELPKEEAALAWLKRHNVKASKGSLYGLISRHGLAYRIGEAQEASDVVAAALPGDAEDRTKAAIKARVFELSLSALGSKEILALEKMNRGSALEREKLAFNQRKHAETTALKAADLALQREKFEFDAAKKAIEHAATIKSIATNRSLDSDARIEQVRLRLFGPAPAQTEGTTP